MRIAIVGKFPPIQGGVSARTYSVAHELAARDHDVAVITNASEVERTHRHVLLPEDVPLVRQRGARSIELHESEPLLPETHIPHDPAFATRLLGLGLDVCSRDPYDLVVGWYLEPYGVVAAVVGQILDRPVLLLHAGSDIERLSNNRDLASAFRWALSRAAVATPKELASRVQAVGARAILSLRAQRRLPDTHLGGTETFEFHRYHLAGQDRFPPALLERQASRVREHDAGHERPIVAVYGKVGETKGTFDLVAALTVLARAEADFTFAAVVSGTERSIRAFVTSINAESTLAERTILLPPLPAWRIPAFLRRCAIVSFLERDFAVDFHAPIVPREVLAAGACLVCSSEIVEKQPFRTSLVDGKNMVEIRNPREITALASRLGELLEDSAMRRDIGRRGKFLSAAWEAELAADDPIVLAIEEAAGAGDVFARISE
jgi:glycosyltransferase involved in cell wall biosynthesis